MSSAPNTGRGFGFEKAPPAAASGPLGGIFTIAPAKTLPKDFGATFTGAPGTVPATALVLALETEVEGTSALKFGEFGA
jgi:hypothetical protein